MANSVTISTHAFSNFHEIRDVEQNDHLVEVRGTVDVNCLRDSERQKAAPFTVDGYAYLIEVYDVSVEGDCEFHSNRFGNDSALT